MKTKQLIQIALCSANIAFAAEPSTNAWWENKHLPGDLVGFRDCMMNAGTTPFAYYTALGAANVKGGNNSDEDYAGGLYYGMKLDLEKYLGWDNTVFKISGIDRHGSSIDSAVGGQYSVMQVVGGQTAFLYELNLEKTFANNLALKLGRMTATDDFVGSPLYSYSLNNAVNGQIRAVLFDGVMTSYPFPVWGGRLKYEPNTEHKFQVGVYQLTEEMWNPNKHGLDFEIESKDGVSVFTQYDWMPTVMGRPAHFFVGMNNAFMDLPKYSGGTQDHLVRFYGHGNIDIMDNVTVFATLGYAPNDDVSMMPLQSTLGINCKGLIPGRPDDHAMLFATYGQFSNALPNIPGEGEKTYEMPIELGYRIQATPAIYVQPDIQYINRPSGTGGIKDAVVLGIQAGVTLF